MTTETEATVPRNETLFVETSFDITASTPDSQRHVIALAMMFSVVCILLSIWCFICHRQKRVAETRPTSITAVGPMDVNRQMNPTNDSPLFPRGNSQYSMRMPTGFNTIRQFQPVVSTSYPKSISFYDAFEQEAYIPSHMVRDLSIQRCACRRSMSHSSSIVREVPSLGHTLNYPEESANQMPHNYWPSKCAVHGSTHEPYHYNHAQHFELDNLSTAAGSFASDCRSFSLRRNESPILSLRKCFAESMSLGHINSMASHHIDV